MKLFLVAPKLAENLDQAAVDARLRLCIEPIADLVTRHMRDDPALFGMRHLTEGSDTPIATDMRLGYAEAIRIGDPDTLREVMIACGDPNSGNWMLIRSLVTCRSVFYGYDGQAFVCLPTDADSIVSPDETLISVEECSQMLVDTCYMDGLAE